MIGLQKLGVAFTALLFTLFVNVAPASAQATRTWVSGVGDDANPCSRTAPCKTFPGAISKTAAGGEINCLDPGGFGGVTITKSISIICDHTEGGVLVSGTNAIVVNAAATDVVYLSGLDIEGVGTGLNGVRILSAASVHVVNSTISDFRGSNGTGISFQPSGASELFVDNVIITRNGTGITIQPTGAGGSGRVTLSNVRIENNTGTGIRMNSTGNTSVVGTLTALNNVQVSGNAIGIEAFTSPGNSSMTGTLVHSTLFNNGTGLSANGSAAQLLVSDTTITGNGIALSATNSGNLTTFGDNILVLNPTPGSFTGSVQPKS